jgi:simple sugar transport system ATP-binding protein
VTDGEAVMSTSPDQPVVELRAVSKYYGNNTAVSGVSIWVNPGEVVGLVGDNGSGKSTLVKMMAGYHKPSAGQIWFAGNQVKLKSPADARARGVEIVYQDLALVEDLSLWRNFFLRRELYRRVGPVRMLLRSEMIRLCRERLDELGLVHIHSVDQPASALSGGEKQSVAISRAIYFGASLLILDEPTAALSVRETENVLRSIDTARSRGLGVIYIDHQLSHVQPVADRIVVLEHGRVAATFGGQDQSVEELKEIVRRQRPNPSK